MDRAELFRLARIKKYDNHTTEKQNIDRSKRMDCSDFFDVVISEYHPVISNIRFSHQGCLLSRAAMNALIESIQDKTVEEALKILESFKKMIQGSAHSDFGLPERLLLFKKFSRFPSRVPCILLGCDSIIKLIGENN